MRLLVNLGTEPGQGVGAAMTHDARAKAIRAWILEYVDLLGWHYDVSPTEEATVVMDVKMRTTTRPAGMLALHKLAVDTQQDCIAVWDCDEGRGLLIGPRASAWEPFDVAKFKWIKQQGVAH